MALRTAHGTGADAVIRVETLPIDELPPLNAEDTLAGIALAKERGRPFERGNKAGAKRKPALVTIAGMPVEAADPDYKRALGWARRYRGARVRELAIQHGGALSAGVCGMLTSSALDMAASRYLTGVAAKTGDAEAMLRASKLSQSSRQLELTALEMASREAQARPSRPAMNLAERLLESEGRNGR